MSILQEWPVQCPYCGEINVLKIDPTVEDQDLVEDCQICCQPMRIRAKFVNGSMVSIEVIREND